MILLTGGLGYIGSHTAVELIQRGYQILIVDNLSNSTIESLDRIEEVSGIRPEFLNIDLRDKKEVDKIFEYDINGCIHFAAFKSVNESVDKPLEYFENNLHSLTNLLSEFKKRNISNFIFSSSCTVYGIPDVVPVSEISEVKMTETPYGDTKRMGEDIIKRSKISSIILRYFNPIGAHPSGKMGEIPNGIPNNLLPYLTQTAKKVRDKLSVFGNDYNTKDGTAIRDYIHVVDLARAHVISLERLLESRIVGPYEIFNIGTGKGNSVLEIIETFEKVNGIKVNWEYTDRREGDIPEIFSDTTKSREVLGFTPQYTIEDSLRHSWLWETNNIK